MRSHTREAASLFSLLKESGELFFILQYTYIFFSINYFWLLPNKNPIKRI